MLTCHVGVMYSPDMEESRSPASLAVRRAEQSTGTIEVDPIGWTGIGVT
jgi:hypothetical protein